MQVLSDSNIGGAGIVVKTIVDNLSDVFETYLVVPKDAQIIERIQARKGLHIIETEGIKDVSFSKEGLKNLKRIIRKVKPDIVHTHSSLSARIAAKGYGKAYIINTRHCVEGISTSPIKFHLKNLVNKRYSHKIIAVSDSIYENLISSGVQKEKIVKINNSANKINILERDKIKELKTSLKLEDKVLIGFIGRLTEVKNPLGLVEIAKNLKKKREDFVFLVAGTGNLENRLKKEIKEHKLEEQFILQGQISDIDSFYNVIDFLVNTSLSEAMPLSILEAMSVSKPIIAFDIDSLSELVINDKNGYLIKKYDTDLYSEAIVKLFNREKRKDFGEESKAMFTKDFSLEGMIDKTEALYKKAYALIKEKK